MRSKRPDHHQEGLSEVLRSGRNAGSKQPSKYLNFEALLRAERAIS
jgi:hypothetical protein